MFAPGAIEVTGGPWTTGGGCLDGDQRGEADALIDGRGRANHAILRRGVWAKLTWECHRVHDMLGLGQLMPVPESRGEWVTTVRGRSDKPGGRVGHLGLSKQWCTRDNWVTHGGVSIDRGGGHNATGLLTHQNARGHRGDDWRGHRYTGRDGGSRDPNITRGEHSVHKTSSEVLDVLVLVGERHIRVHI